MARDPSKRSILAVSSFFSLVLAGLWIFPLQWYTRTNPDHRTHVHSETDEYDASHKNTKTHQYDGANGSAADQSTSN